MPMGLARMRRAGIIYSLIQVRDQSFWPRTEGCLGTWELHCENWDSPGSTGCLVILEIRMTYWIELFNYRTKDPQVK